VLGVRRLPRLCALALLIIAWSAPAAATPSTGNAPAQATLKRFEPGEPCPFSKPRSRSEVSSLAERIANEPEPFAAIDALGAREGSEASCALASLLGSGLPDAGTDRILEKLVEHPRPATLDALEAMARHRRPAARVLALRAIAALGMRDGKLGMSTSKMLAAGLRDSDPRVRGTAASALGQRFERIDRETKAVRGAKPAAKAPPVYDGVVDVLLLAVGRGVPEAARAAGLAVPEAALPRLHEALRGLPMSATLDAYDAALARNTLSEAAKLEVIARLGEIATPATKTFLSTLIAKARFPLNSPLQRALIETEKRIVPRPAAANGAAP
jgi:hypothetical protein